MKKVLITGGTGFIGSEVCKELCSNNFQVVELGRTASGYSSEFFRADLNDLPAVFELIRDVDVVIHIAARAHVMHESASDSSLLYMSINCQTTLDLANQAAEAGVKRFIFISTVKVNGESSYAGHPFRFDDKPNPRDSYSLSKADAEQGLKEIAQKTNMDVVIIRPPLVYGPGVKANFSAMMNLAKKNLPLPLGAIHNKRSLVALTNLVDLIITCIKHPKAANQVFLVSDDKDVSTTELLKMMTHAFGKKPRLVPLPMSWLMLLGRLTCKKAVVDRLCSNLQVDITHTKETLDWKPPITLEEGIKLCVLPIFRKRLNGGD